MKHPKVFAALFYSLLILSVLTAPLAGCSKKRTKAVRKETQAVEEEAKDYRGMIKRIRDKQATNSQYKVSLIQKATERFQIHVGRLPTNLHELVRFKYLKKIPDPPAGMAYKFDHKKGIIMFIKAKKEDVTTRKIDAPTLAE